MINAATATTLLAELYKTMKRMKDMKDMKINFTVYILHDLHVLHGKIKYSMLKLMTLTLLCGPDKNQNPLRFLMCS